MIENKGSIQADIIEMLFEQFLPVDPDEEIQIPEAGLKLITIVPPQMLSIIIEQILKEVKVLKRFDNSREDKGYPVGMISMCVVLNRHSFQNLLFFNPTTRHSHLVAILSQLLMLLTNVDDEQYHLVEEVLFVGLEQVDDQGVPEEGFGEGLVLVLE